MQRPRTTNRNAWIPDEHLKRIEAQLTTEDKLICALALQTGFRIEDLLSLTWAECSHGAITARESKTGKTRTHVVSNQTADTLRRLRDTVRDRPGAQTYIFPTRRGRAGDKPTLSRWSVWRAFRRAVRDAELTGYGYTVHSLRKCYAWHLYRATLSIAAVQADLNHDRPETTFIYLREPLEMAARLL